ncbi:MAG TPA: hypothetical protein VHK69_03195, partial [Chitinophagaceae bacterium]|nr:hypothetical protein [Chitinophagaceae bacterium]
MKRFFSLALSALLLACGNGDREPEAAAPASENEEDAARNFIRAVLDADFAQAQRFMIVDSVNSQYLNNSERIFRERLSPQ